MLWEVGPDGADVRALRARLGLDSGYLSRSQALAADGLLVVEPSERDGRVRTARLTRLGRAERAELDGRNDAWRLRSSTRSVERNGSASWARWPRSSVF